MLHAFRRYAPYTWDQFGAGIVHSAWLYIQRILAEGGIETNFNDLYHDEKLPEDPNYQRPFYAYRDTYNQTPFATRMADFFDTSHSGLNTNIMKIRYGTCGYLWWQVLESDPDFIKNFNDNLLTTWNEMYPNRPEYEHLVRCAIAAYDGPGINGITDIQEWIAGQPILNNDFYVGLHLGVGNYDNELKMALYSRQGHWEGSLWVEEEFGIDNGEITVERFDYLGNPIGVTKLTTTHGFAKCPLPFVGVGGEPQRNKVLVTAVKEGAEKLESAFFLDALYPLASEVFGIIEDVDEGLMTLDRPEGEDLTAPLHYGAYIFDAKGGPPDFEAGEFKLTCEVYGSAALGTFENVFTKDSSRMFRRESFEVAMPLDENGNGIPDSDERLLAQKFVPEIQMSTCS